MKPALEPIMTNNRKSTPPKAAAAASNSATTADGVKTYTVVTTVTHDQVQYDPDSTIELDDDTAAPLLKVGAIAGDGDDEPAA